ncbi:MAG: hypothetical protein J5497_03155, partial [Selenomonadaceae bacterium]|nr:hypothetical protein [Selenomonadaceae bacterium]
VTAGDGSDFVSVGGNNFINAGAGDNTVYGSYSNNITLGGGNDFVSVNSGNTINAGDGANTVYAGTQNQITLGGGNDVITLSGGGNTVYAGSGSDFVALLDNNNVINLGSDSAADTISVGANVTQFTVAEFNVEDVIEFTGSISGLSMVDGNLVATVGSQVVTISGISSVYEVNGGWSYFDSTSLGYQQTTIAGATYSGTQLTLDENSGTSKLFKIDGLSTAAGLSLADKVVSVEESALWARAKDTITIDNDYKFTMLGGSGDDKTISTSSANFSGGTYTISEDGVYTFAKGFTGNVVIAAGVTNVKLIGASTQLKDVFIDASAVSGINLWIENLNINNTQCATADSGTNRSTIRFGSGTNNLVVQGTNTLTNEASDTRYHKKALINIGKGTLNITSYDNTPNTHKLTAKLTGDNSYGAAIGGDNNQKDTDTGTITIINIGGYVNITATAFSGAGIGSGDNGSVTTINIGGSAKVEASSNLGAGIGSGYGYGSRVGTINIGGSAQVNATSTQGAGIGFGYNASSDNTSPGKVTIYQGATVNASSVSNRADSSDNTDPVPEITTPEEPVNASGTATASVSAIYGTLGGAGWYENASTSNVTFNIAGLSDYFTLQSASSIVYHEETLGAVQ